MGLQGSKEQKSTGIALSSRGSLPLPGGGGGWDPPPPLVGAGNWSRPWEWVLPSRGPRGSLASSLLPFLLQCLPSVARSLCFLMISTLPRLPLTLVLTLVRGILYTSTPQVHGSFPGLPPVPTAERRDLPPLTSSPRWDTGQSTPFCLWLDHTPLTAVLVGTS